MKRRHVLLIVVIALLPALLGVIAARGMTSAIDHTDRVPAAIVNLDEPATLSSGTTLPGGRQILAELTKDSGTSDGQSSGGGTSSDLEWSVVTADTAASGLSDGTYRAVVTIPKDFSASLVDVLQNGATSVPQVSVVADGSSSPAMGQVSQALVSAAAQEFGTTLTVSYLDQSLTAMGTLHDSLSDAASGADQLASGATSAQSGASVLSRGTSQLSSGLSELADGSSQLSSGASSLSSGVSSYTSGVSQVASGASGLASGAEQLSAGVSAYTQGVNQVYTGITQAQQGQSTSLVDGAAQVAAGASAMAKSLAAVDTSSLEQLPAGLTTAADGADQAAAALTGTEPTSAVALIKACQAAPTSGACGDAEQVVQGVSADLSSSKADSLGATLRTTSTAVEKGVTQLQGLSEGAEQAQQLAVGAQGVSAGISTVASGIQTNLLGTNADTLTSGAASLATGARQLESGVSTLDGNSSTLVSGADSLASGASTLSTGASSAASAGTEVATGTQALASGISQLSDGSSSLASGLTAATGQIPTYTSDQAQSMAQAIASPVGVTSDTSDSSSTVSSLAGIASAVALWLGALAGVAGLASISRRRLDAAMTPVGLVIVTMRPVLVAAVAQALLLWGALAVVGVHMSHAWAVGGVLLVSSICLTIIHQALTAVFGRRGGIVASLVLLVLQAVSMGGLVPSQAHTGIFALSQQVLPVPIIENAVRTLIVGSGAAIGSGLTILVVWAVISAVATVIGVAKRRQTTLGEVRADVAGSS